MGSFNATHEGPVSIDHARSLLALVGGQPAGMDSRLRIAGMTKARTRLEPRPYAEGVLHQQPRERGTP